MFKKLDHVGIVAATWVDARGVLIDQLAMTVDIGRTPTEDGVYFAPERTHNYFVRVGLGETRVEVLIPADTTSGTAKYLSRFGPGLHHLGYACEDVEVEAERLSEAGLRRIDLGPSPDGRALAAFFHPKSAGGILTELVPERP